MIIYDASEKCRNTTSECGGQLLDYLLKGTMDEAPSGDFKEEDHPRGGKGSKEGGRFVKSEKTKRKEDADMDDLGSQEANQMGKREKEGIKIGVDYIDAYKEEIGRLHTDNPVYAAAYKAFKDENHDMSGLKEPTTHAAPTEEDWENAIPILTDGDVDKSTDPGDYKYYKWVYSHGRLPLDPKTHSRFV